MDEEDDDDDDLVVAARIAAVETAKSFNCAAVRVNVGVGVEGGG